MQQIATVRVCIPVKHNAPVETRGRARRVLFISADGDLRAAATRVLEGEEYDVQAVAHSGHALLLCRTTEFDAAVAELSGPDVSGPTLAEQLRRHCPGLAVVYLANPGTPERVNHVLVRPFTGDDLIRRLEVAMAAVTA
jgi:CheY-like chemotaxis protein